ncbi:uncharacterized protein LOC111045750 isoform X1 [Nilaparvata lugens]|uniref:uncharacterized protein LOC111045750 isoform X1 n=1 Tax=Nilaparvata lugens TaxID=108931 RepID=UPI00193E91FF|nr:uncharacterized protein LOC111045750 isoform X1 [Nilaparvata lugens]
MRHAVIHLNSSSHQFHVTKNSGLFMISLPPGYYHMQVSCKHYLNTTVAIVVNPDKMTYISVVLKKAHDDGFVISHKGMGISGVVTDTQKHPLEGAIVSVSDTKYTTVNKYGAYWLPLDPGEHTVKVHASGYLLSTKLATLMKEKPEQTLVFRLIKDETVLGLPRLVFILLSGLIGMMSMGICFCCYMQCKTESYSSGFSLIPQKSALFDDDDDEKDTELFRTPIRGSITRPYYDESDLDLDEGSLSEEDIIVVR